MAKQADEAMERNSRRWIEIVIGSLAGVIVNVPLILMLVKYESSVSGSMFFYAPNQFWYLLFFFPVVFHFSADVKVDGRSEDTGMVDADGRHRHPKVDGPLPRRPFPAAKTSRASQSTETKLLTTPLYSEPVRKRAPRRRITREATYRYV